MTSSVFWAFRRGVVAITLMTQSFPLLLNSLGPQTNRTGTSQRMGSFPDSQTAVKIAEAVLIPVYGEKQIRSEEPFTGHLKGDVVDRWRNAPLFRWQMWICDRL
jgi:hypothetical protein